MSLFEDASGGSPRRVTLVRLAGEIARCVAGVGPIVVEGEVYRPTTTRGGWVYFTLRDRAAQIDVKMPAAVVRRYKPAPGERVEVAATLQWSNERGQLALLAQGVAPVGAGAIAALIEATRAALGADGLLDRPRRPIPMLPRAIGVVCGADAAVRKDIESVVAARCPGYPVVFFETTVSGPTASRGIVEGIRALSSDPAVEVIVLARGGGDAPSLLPWSTEEVCRAAAACPVPVVSAIGHESDRPLCDEVADLRCPTPSLAATAVVPDVAGLMRRVDEALQDVAWAVQQCAGRAEHRLAAVQARLALTGRLEQAAFRFERATIRLEGGHPRRALRLAEDRMARTPWRRHVWEELGRAAGRLDSEVRHLRALSPQRTLERGYAVVTAAGGTVIRRAADLAPGDAIDVRLAEGSLVASISSVTATVELRSPGMVRP
jgi:exodeoxyribonuclease VII large subunit